MLKLLFRGVALPVRGTGTISFYANGASYPRRGTGQIPRKLNATILAAGGISFVQARVKVRHRHSHLDSETPWALRAAPALIVSVSLVCGAGNSGYPVGGITHEVVVQSHAHMCEEARHLDAGVASVPDDAVKVYFWALRVRAAATEERNRMASVPRVPVISDDRSLILRGRWQNCGLGFLLRQHVLPEYVPELFFGEGGKRLRETIER